MKIKNKDLIPILWFFLFAAILVLQQFSLSKLAYVVELVFLITTPLVVWLIKENKKLSFQFLIPVTFFLAIWGFGVFNKYAHKNHKELILIGGLSLFISFVWLVLILRKTISKQLIINLIKNNAVILLISLVFVIFTASTIFEIPYCDSEYYYCWDAKKLSYDFDYTFGNIGDFRFAIHLSFGYTLWALLAELIYPMTSNVMHIGNICLAFVAVISIYRVFCKTHSKDSNTLNAIKASVVGFSPMILGIIGYINLDVPAIYFFLFILAAYFEGNRLFQVIAATMFVFTKEPAIVYYFFFCVGILVVECKRSKKASDQSIVGIIFEQVLHYIPEIIPAIFWLLSFVSLGSEGWAETNSTGFTFGFTIDNFSQKMRQIFILNFEWIFVVMIIVAVVLQVMKYKKVKYWSDLASLCAFMLLGILLFNLFYIDHPTYRYITLAPVCICIICIEMMDVIHSTKSRLIVFSLLSALMLIQSMVSIDPVSYLCFDKCRSYGSNMIITTAGPEDILSVTNREYSYYYNAINKVLRDCEYNGKDDIIFVDTRAPYGPMYDFNWDRKLQMMRPTDNENTVMMNMVSPSDSMGEYNDDNLRNIYICSDGYDDGVHEYKQIRYRTVTIKYYIEDKSSNDK